MEIPSFIDVGSKKYEYQSLANNRWARSTYLELGEQVKLLTAIQDKESKEYYMQLGVVCYLIRTLESYLTLVRVS